MRTLKLKKEYYTPDGRRIKGFFKVNGKAIPIVENEGLGAEWLDFSGSYGKDWNPQVDEHARALQYLQMLKDNGVIDNDVDLEEAHRYFVHYGEYNISEYENSPYGKMAEALVKFPEGRTKRGYGDFKREFDKKYGVSDFIDSHKSLQLDTDIPMYRGVRTSQKEIELLKMMQGTNSPISMKGLSSWTANKNMAERFTIDTLGASGDVRLVYKDTTQGKRNAIPLPYSGQHEALYSKNNEFYIVNILQDNRGRYEVELRRKK